MDKKYYQKIQIKLSEGEINIEEKKSKNEIYHEYNIN